MNRTVRWLSLSLVLTMASIGCIRVGPGTIKHDRFDYNQAISSSWKEQILLNIVKLRYADAPVFLDVSSVISQYSLEGSVGVASPSWDRPSAAGMPVGSIGGKWSERPTITYTPIQGDRFTRSIMTPISPVAVVSLVQSGWPAKFVLGLSVQSINGISNGSRTAIFRKEPDPRFTELLEALDALRLTSSLGMRIEERGEGKTAILLLQGREATAADQEAEKRIERILGLSPDLPEVKLTYGSLPRGQNEIAVLTRSYFEILGEMAFGVEVSALDIEEGRCKAGPASSDDWPVPAARVQSGADAPRDAYAAVRYRDRWFWVDDRDFESKSIFTFLLLISSLAESGIAPSTPLLTVTTGN